MKKIIIALLLLVVPCPAQTVIRWQDSSPQASQFWLEGYRVRTLTADGVTVGALIMLGKKDCIVVVAVMNQGNQQIDVIPSAITLGDVLKPQKPFPAIDPNKFAERISKSARRDAIWSVMASMFLTSQSQSSTSGTVAGQIGPVPVTGTYNESTTTTRPNAALQDLAIQKGQQDIASAETQAARVLAYALRANTIRPGESIKGNVYYSFGKLPKEMVLRVPIREKVFELPFYNK